MRTKYCILYKKQKPNTPLCQRADNRSWESSCLFIWKDKRISWISERNTASSLWFIHRQRFTKYSATVWDERGQHTSWNLLETLLCTSERYFRVMLDCRSQSRITLFGRHSQDIPPFAHSLVWPNLQPRIPLMANSERKVTWREGKKHSALKHIQESLWSVKESLVTVHSAYLNHAAFHYYTAVCQRQGI